MKPTFQLDENINCRKLRQDCHHIGKCILARYPKSFMGKKDYAMLPIMLRRDRTIVTTDYRIVEDNRDSIVFPNCGILVFKPSSSGTLKTGTLTIKQARKLIEKFKLAFPTWNSQIWTNVHVDIYEEYVSISLLCAERDPPSESFGFGDENFYFEAKAYIAKIQTVCVPLVTAANTRTIPG